MLNFSFVILLGFFCLRRFSYWVRSLVTQGKKKRVNLILGPIISGQLAGVPGQGFCVAVGGRRWPKECEMKRRGRRVCGGV